MTQTQWQIRFKEWQDFAAKVDSHAANIRTMRDARGWALAASVGIPKCGCSLHNASIDTEMTGWCANNPRRLKVAKQARYILDNHDAGRLATRIISRAYDRMLRSV